MMLHLYWMYLFMLMCAAETGLQLLGRLTTRPSLSELSDALFPDGLKSKEVIEICGDINCGKTLLLIKLIIKCILPKAVNNIIINGLDCTVILINIDHHFQIFKLTELMEQYLDKCIVNTSDNQSSNNMDFVNKENIIKYSLKNLILFNIYNGFQLQVTLHSLKQLIADNSKISLVILDSISSNYWQDIQTGFYGNIRKMDAYAKRILKSLKNCINDFNMCLIYTCQSNFKSAASIRKIDEINFGLDNDNVTRKIYLQTFQFLKNGKICYRCIISTTSSKEIKFYSINSSGFEWITLNE
ncbi:X-ray repair cross complementing 2 isoform X2 [Lycorma delicatula]|uniref:X-ray repair cross complementing 2 isoform X2 n=1 Tax=Lycorma delicatula TaxID=130591 RepID=UPI003F5140B7